LAGAAEGETADVAGGGELPQAAPQVKTAQSKAAIENNLL
jgi:hypothetical protein